MNKFINPTINQAFKIYDTKRKNVVSLWLIVANIKKVLWTLRLWILFSYLHFFKFRDKQQFATTSKTIILIKKGSLGSLTGKSSC